MSDKNTTEVRVTLPVTVTAKLPEDSRHELAPKCERFGRHHDDHDWIEEQDDER
jgi:hypothetical protein